MTDLRCLKVSQLSPYIYDVGPFSARPILSNVKVSAVESHITNVATASTTTNNIAKLKKNLSSSNVTLGAEST